MKNNQKNRNCNNCHSQRPSGYAKHPADIGAEVVKRMSVLGADINITEGVTVPVPREEYDELVYCSALVDILHKLFDVGGKYATCDLLEKLFKTDDEKEDK